jgi:quinol-cytochrome oxidoreductase complex cytochrome b subunit
LHEFGSTNPLGISSKTDNVFFYPYYIFKDILGVVFILLGFSLMVFFYPEVLGHTDNYIKANPLVTPEHIVPE